jgi:hypothetical protein
MAKSTGSILDRLTRRVEEAEREALKLYRPLNEKAMRVHTSRAHELIVSGGKRAGKSTCVAAEVASRFCGIPVMGIDGQPIPLRWPASTEDDPHTYWIIGINTEHIGKTVHRLLFQKGQGGKLRAIRDLQTGQWRIYNKANPEDAARHKETVRTSGMIPERMIPSPKSWAWKRARSHEFLSVRLTNGSVIYAFPSSARNPAMGDAVDGIWINEDIENPEFIKEWQDRLNDTDGWLIWDAFPQMHNNAIGDLLDRAEEAAEEEDPNIEAVQLWYTENPYIAGAAKERALERMGSDDEVARRDRGERLTSLYTMYDFVPTQHLLDRNDGKGEEVVRHGVKRTAPRDLLEKLLADNGRLPTEWSRYLAIDPSHQRTGILSFVVTPFEYAGVRLLHRLIVEWELVLLRALGKDAAKAVKEKMGTHANYRAFVMDKMKGQQHSAQEGRTTFQVWSNAFQEEGIQSRETGFGFIRGLADPGSCATYVRQLMAATIDDLPMLLFVADSTIETQREFKTFRKRVLLQGGQSVIVDQPANPRKHDCMAALQYGVAELHPRLQARTAFYMEAEQKAVPMIPDWLEESLAKARKDDSCIHLGPGTAA